LRYLLDTNVLSHLVRDPQGEVAQRLSQQVEAEVFTSVIVACELRYGARKRGSAVLSGRIAQLLASLDVAALDPTVDEVYASIRAALESRGAPIGANDLLIAAHAISLDATLVTDNTAEFCRVPQLRVENWQRQD
jgi:tRNA(fMet)-specific endonuclease VapC